MMVEGLDSKVMKLVIWKVLDMLSWRDWQGAEGVEMGEVSVLVGKEERRGRGRREVRSCAWCVLWGEFEYGVCWLD